MEGMETERFIQEDEGDKTLMEKTEEREEEAEAQAEKARKDEAFQELISTAYRDQFEAAVAQRVQEALAQRFSQAAPGAMEKRQGNPALRQHFERLVRQGEELRQSFPGFDLMQEMQNPEFVRLTAPGTGMSVKDAFFALHGEEIQRQSMLYAAQRAGERLAASVQAGASRPMENGMQDQSPVAMGVDIRGMDKKRREEYRRRIHNGESINFSDKM